MISPVRHVRWKNDDFLPGMWLENQTFDQANGFIFTLKYEKY